MAYIPENHKKYKLLPLCQKDGGEVFSYPNDIFYELFNLGESDLDPYGYKSYEEYFSELDKRILELQDQKTEVAMLLKEYKKAILNMNQKEVWSVLKYVGMDTDNITGLKNGRYYYWPCSLDNPVYEGVIDDEEFTSYIYPTEADLWEIAEDSTGMAYRTIYGRENL